MKIETSKDLICYHRNGMSGIGFYVIAFSYIEDGITRHAIATVSERDVDSFAKQESHDPDTRVLIIGSAGGINITETMRGDNFHEALMDAIATLYMKRR